MALKPRLGRHDPAVRLGHHRLGGDAGLLQGRLQRRKVARHQREAYERDWTDANYAALTEVLATLPVNWRHYMKKRIFAALEEVPAHQRRGDGSEVRRAFALTVGEFPQLRPAQAAE
jgi:hypothetical protein